jgi:hypothetical protein
MPASGELFTRPACPLLPQIDAVLHPAVTREFAGLKCDRFYEACLRYAQSLWRQGKPAQAILQLNKSLMADLGGHEAVLRTWPAPYATLLWILRHRDPGDFVGNPVRHFQHLATRVSGDRRELRSWRAWACYYLSRNILDPAEFPPDLDQIAKESLEIPDWQTVLSSITALGWPDETATLLAASVSLNF